MENEKKGYVVNLNETTMVRNLCDWDVYLKNKSSSSRDSSILLTANSVKPLTNAEIIAQYEDGSIFFVGDDGKGSHAKVYIEDANLREHIGFEKGEMKQIILNDERCKFIFDSKTKASFEKNIKEYVVMNHEKDRIMKYARKIKVNDYDKISFLEDYTGIKFREE